MKLVIYPHAAGSIYGVGAVLCDSGGCGVLTCNAYRYGTAAARLTAALDGDLAGHCADMAAISSMLIRLATRRLMDSGRIGRCAEAGRPAGAGWPVEVAQGARCEQCGHDFAGPAEHVHVTRPQAGGATTRTCGSMPRQRCYSPVVRCTVCRGHVHHARAITVQPDEPKTEHYCVSCWQEAAVGK